MYHDELVSVLLDLADAEDSAYERAWGIEGAKRLKAEAYRQAASIIYDAGPEPLPESIQWALNSGDGTYRP